MVRTARAGGRTRSRVPRASGDGPTTSSKPSKADPCSPRERGWSATGGPRRPGATVFPARAGMVPSGSPSRRTWTRVPRASGDGPVRWSAELTTRECSPRERGWSQRADVVAERDLVFPARAGMVPNDRTRERTSGSVPRASGDGPGWTLIPPAAEPCSPRERGWSRGVAECGSVHGVFPARAGMVRLRRGPRRRAARVPRASGDGPSSSASPKTPAPCSPRERGWSVLHARAERGRESVPRASGDGPGDRGGTAGFRVCSPRERGWSHVR